MASREGIEPTLTVLETAVIPLDHRLKKKIHAKGRISPGFPMSNPAESKGLLTLGHRHHGWRRLAAVIATMGGAAVLQLRDTDSPLYGLLLVTLMCSREDGRASPCNPPGIEPGMPSRLGRRCTDRVVGSALSAAHE